MRGEEAMEIRASPERVYDLVSDLPRMGEFSPECYRVEWLNGADRPAAGVRFRGHNRVGPLRWSRLGTVITAKPGREFCFATEEEGRKATVWRYQLTPSPAGTVATESFDAVWVAWWLHAAHVITRRERQLHRGMRHTLERVKSAAEFR
jgi:uncharacterized protein YndB with AHSA1/START domain